MRKIKFFEVEFTYAELIKIVLMTIIAIYIAFWLITLCGIVIVALYDKNPGVIIKFWIRINSLSPVASIAIFLAVMITAYKIIKKEKENVDIYKKHSLNK